MPILPDFDQNGLQPVRMRQMWMFVLYTIGVACVYDVFDQQFATFFVHSLTLLRRE